MDNYEFSGIDSIEKLDNSVDSFINKLNDKIKNSSLEEQLRSSDTIESKIGGIKHILNNIVDEMFVQENNNG